MAAARSAAISAATAARPCTPERARFALAGPSRPLDLKHNAARRDLADIRLAGRWFAPHYAEAEYWVAARPFPLLEAPLPTASEIDMIEAEQQFAVLELSGVWAWGFRTSDGLVGYAEIDALSPEGAMPA